jgi:hypothetical protein
MKAKRKVIKKSKAIFRFLGLSLHPGWTVKKGTKLVTKAVEATGIPEGYSSVVAWFAERIILAAICISATSFASGVLYTLYLAPPIAESETYGYISSKAHLAKEQVIDLASPIFGKLIDENREEDLQKKQLAERKEKIRQYLLSKKSPFAHDEGALEAFAASKNMKLMIAISFVESTFGKHCYYYNCSGIGGSPPRLRKYASYAEWIADFDQLLEKRYKNLKPEKFIGLYVQPGSPNWLYGVKQVLREFEELEIT